VNDERRGLFAIALKGRRRAATPSGAARRIPRASSTTDLMRKNGPRRLSRSPLR